MYLKEKNKQTNTGHLGSSVSGVAEFGSGHDLMVHELQPYIGVSAVSPEPALDPLSPSFSLHLPLLTVSLSPSKINKH